MWYIDNTQTSSMTSPKTSSLRLVEPAIGAGSTEFHDLVRSISRDISAGRKKKIDVQNAWSPNSPIVHLLHRGLHCTTRARNPLPLLQSHRMSLRHFHLNCDFYSWHNFILTSVLVVSTFLLRLPPSTFLPLFLLNTTVPASTRNSQRLRRYASLSCTLSPRRSHHACHRRLYQRHLWSQCCPHRPCLRQSRLRGPSSAEPLWNRAVHPCPIKRQVNRALLHR
jgi:hypothetical protein